MSEYEIPGHVLIIMVVICLYSRDGVLMKKQVTVTNEISVIISAANRLIGEVVQSRRRPLLRHY